MAERSEKVFERVRQELAKNANLGSRELYEIAKKVDGSMEDSLQQFHARYVLPVRRTKAGGGAGGARRGARGQKAKRTGATANKAAKSTGRGARARRALDARDNARAVLLRFAQDFSAAESKSDSVRLMSRLDEYFDQLSANGRGYHHGRTGRTPRPVRGRPTIVPGISASPQEDCSGARRAPRPSPDG